MDEARRVRERLSRIDAVRAERGGARAVLAELDALVDETRAWLDADSRRGRAGGSRGRGDDGGRPAKGMIAM